MACGATAKLVTGSVIAAILIAVGVGMIWEFKIVIRNKIESSVVLKNGSESYDAWKDPPVTVYMKFWLFNVTNADDVLNNDAKPQVEEIGPYVYSELRPKEHLEFSEDGTILSYRQPKSYVFEPSLSAGSEDDNFTSVNLPLLTVATEYPLPAWLKLLWKLALSATGESLFQQHSVGGFLWGYDLTPLQAINHFFEKYFNKTVIKDDKFGLFYGPTGNGTDDGLYKINTGTEDLSMLNQITEWNGTSSLKYWNTTNCNMINGTDGSMWHPFVNTSERLYLFSTDICRSIYVTYKETRTEKGIKLYRFTPPPEVFANASINPENEGYCVPECLDSGVLDVSVCRGAPIVISQPHFYEGSDRYINAIEGLHPGPEHSTIVDVEPNTGAVLNVAKKLQLNAFIKPIEYVTGKISDRIIFPVIWLTEGASLDDTVAHDFRHMVLTPMTILTAVQYGLIGLGGVLLLIMIFGAVMQAARNKGSDEDKRGLVVSADNDDAMHGDV